MNIGIELRGISLGSSGGIAQHLQGLLGALFTQHPETAFTVFCTIFNRRLLQPAPANVDFVSLPAASFWDRLDEELKERQIDLLFRSYPLDDTLSFPLVRQVFEVPDIQHEIFPEFFEPEILKARQAAFNRALSGAGGIATLTQFTRQTILDHPLTRCKNIVIASPALQWQQYELPPLTPAEAAQLPRGAFFYIPGNLWPHKNHRRVLQAFERFLQVAPQQVELILTGHPQGWDELQAEFPSLPARHLGFVSPQMVQALFKQARALVFFTLYEGFGMPLLEAFAAGTPVICSSTTSLPEVGGDAVLTCDPTDIDAMSGLMLRILQDDPLRAQLVERGRQRLGLFSWNTSAENLFNAFNLALASVDSPQLHPYQPLVTIVTPSYNQGRFLRRTIDSVLNQTYPKIEYIVMDGGSTDHSLEILTSYGERFQWVSEPDRGQTHAINKGFERANGEVLAYLNSDDVLEPDAVECAVRYFGDHPDCDLLYGRAYYIDENDVVTGMYNTDEYSFKRLMKDDMICQPAAFWTARIAKEVGPFDESMHTAMDYEYWLRIAHHGGVICHTHEILGRSRIYADTKTARLREKVYGETFFICKKYGGYVDLNYFYGLWNHLIWEKQTGFPARWLRFSQSFKIMARLHYYWFNRGYLWQQARARHKSLSLRGIKQNIAHWSKQNLDVLRPLVRALRARRYQVSEAVPVFGCWADNWLGPVVQFSLRRRSPDQTFYLAGTPALDMLVEIRAEKRLLQRLPLRGWQYTTIEIPPLPESRISLRFTRAQKDQSNRYLCFLLADTNLFSEADALS